MTSEKQLANLAPRTIVVCMGGRACILCLALVACGAPPQMPAMSIAQPPSEPAVPDPAAPAVTASRATAPKEVPTADADIDRALVELATTDVAGQLPEEATAPDVAFDPRLPFTLAPYTYQSAPQRRPSGRRPPRVRMGSTNVSGRLPREVVLRVVRRKFGPFRLCYEQALRNDPKLQGKVVVRFVISRDGSVTNVDGKGDIPDGAVISCVSREFYSLRFPQPEGGIVTVTFPIVFSPGE